MISQQQSFSLLCKSQTQKKVLYFSLNNTASDSSQRGICGFGENVGLQLYTFKVMFEDSWLQ